MSNIEDIVDALENKIGRVMVKLELLKDTNLNLTQKLEASQNTILRQSSELEVWQEKYETLKMANTILGSDNDKRETKLKLNALIRDIDHCIGQLSE